MLSPLPPQTGDNSQSCYLSYKYHSVDPWFSWQFMAASWDSYFYFEGNTTDSNCGSVGSTTNLSADTWYHVVGVYAHDQPLKMYVNGVNDSAELSGSPTGNILDTDSTFSLGWYVDGILDEFRISNVARSADWIATEYSNQSDPASFITLGPTMSGEAGLAGALFLLLGE